MSIGLYDLLPLILRTRDSEASDGPDGPILKRVLESIQAEVDTTTDLIEGLRDLIDIKSTDTLILSLLCKGFGSTIPQNISDDFKKREFTRELVNSYKIKGMVLSWIRMIKLRELGNYTPVELYKSQYGENLNYSPVQTDEFPYRAARVLFQSSGYGAALESLPTWDELIGGGSWEGLLGPIQWQELLESGDWASILEGRSKELLIGQWCKDHTGLVSNQLGYTQALALMNTIEVVPIHVLPPIPVCSTVIADFVKETCDSLNGTTIHYSPADGKSFCQERCEYDVQNAACVTENCESFCEVNCEVVQETYETPSGEDDVGCTTECQCGCVLGCEIACESSCEGDNCEIKCERNCQAGCQFTYTLTTDNLAYTVVCKSACMAECQTKCNNGCQYTCASSCEESCQFACEGPCQVACEFHCQERCEQTCQDNCQSYCQDTCEPTCQDGCQVACQTACQGSCEDAGQVCTKGCQIACQTDKQSVCEGGCEDSCQTQSQVEGCKLPGGSCSGSYECNVPASPPTALPPRAYGDAPVASCGLAETGCATTAETCQTRSQGYPFLRQNTGFCNFLRQLGSNKPIDTALDHATVTITFTGYKTTNIPVVIWREDTTTNKTESYWGTSGGDGKLTINIPLKEFVVQPVWYEFPKLAFDPPTNTIDFGVDPNPSISFATTALEGGSRKACVAWSGDWCGYFGEWPVTEPTTVLGYHREPHSGWDKATEDEYTVFLQEGGFDIHNMPGTFLDAFWNHGQIIFDPPEEDVGEIRFLLLYDADYRFVSDNGRLLAWSPMIPPLTIEKGDVLKIPHHSQVFYMLMSRERRPFLGDHRPEKMEVPVQIFLPTICETTCQLTCQVGCTTSCEITKNDTCTAGCTSWCTVGCMVSCQYDEETCAGSCTTTSCTATSCTTSNQSNLPDIRQRAIRTWTWDTAPPTEWTEDTTDGEWILSYYDNVAPSGAGGWDEAAGAIYSEAYGADMPVSTCSVQSETDFRSHTTRTWKLVDSCANIFGIPEGALVTNVRLVSLDIRCTHYSNGMIYYGTEYDDEFNGKGIWCNYVRFLREPALSQYYTGGRELTISTDNSIWEGKAITGANAKWTNIGPQVPASLLAFYPNPVAATQNLEFILPSYYRFDNNEFAHARLWYDNLTLEVFYTIKQTAGCTENCQAKCQTACESGCAASCHDGCQTICESGPCQAKACESNNNQVPGCRSDCQQNCQLPGCQSGCTITGGCQIPCQLGCHSNCQSACQMECEFDCQTKCEYEAQTGCEVTTCQDSCQTACQRFCQIYSQGGYQKGFDFVNSTYSSCQSTSCETKNQYNCADTCETWQQLGTCVSSCMSACEWGTTQIIGCYMGCEINCQLTCELACELTDCETRSEGVCATACEFTTQTEVCDITCQAASCQTACENQVQTMGCQERCQMDCESACQKACQIECETTSCQHRCEVQGRQK